MQVNEERKEKKTMGKEKLGYSYGYVAYLDILGFSATIAKSKTPGEFENLFAFYKQLQDLLAVSFPQMKMSFCSDSVFLTCTDYEKGKFKCIQMFSAIYLLAETLYKQCGLLFRGGVTEGWFYHDETNIFGEAVNRAVTLEADAKTSRILLDSKKKLVDTKWCNTIRDVDNCLCVNLYAELFAQKIGQFENKGISSRKEAFQILLHLLDKTRDSVIQMCQAHINKPEAGKYLFQCYAFNQHVHLITNNIRQIDNFNVHIKRLSREEKEEVTSYVIRVEDLY